MGTWIGDPQRCAILRSKAVAVATWVASPGDKRKHPGSHALEHESPTVRTIDTNPSFQRRRDKLAAQAAERQHHLQIEAERDLLLHRRDRLASAIESARLELGSLEAELAAIEQAVDSP